jgi:hypothetical protein
VLNFLVLRFLTEFCSDVLPLKETLSGGYVDVLFV